jgi:tetratricopeptide (TPR) repeat protein
MGSWAVFLFLGLFALAASSLAQDVSGSQSQRTQSSLTSPTGHFNSITGSVRSFDNQPLRDVRVELRDGNTGQMVNTAYTGAGGSFEFTELAQGFYQVVALLGTQQTEERVQVDSWSTMVNLRLPIGRAARDDNGTNSISVAQYQVPEKAREELRKAREASVKGRLDDAQAHLGKALEIHPDYADALTLRAILKLSSRDTEGAMVDLERAIQCDSSYGMAYLVLGSAFNIESKFDDAIRVLEQGERLAPDAWQAYFELGKAYAGKNEYEAAVRQLDRAQTMAPPDYPLIHLVRAHVLMQLSRFTDAVADLETYLEKNPSGPDSDLAQKMLEHAKASGGVRK